MVILTFDDRDSQVTYLPNGDWLSGGVSAEFNSTTTFTNIGGCTAWLTFSGTSITVYGTIANIGVGLPPNSSYSVDGGLPQLYNATMQQNVQYQQTFFRSGALPAGQHTLLVAAVGDGGYLYLDYFLVDETMVSSSTASTATTFTSTSSSQAGETSSQPSSSESHKPPLSAIIGGVLGGLAVIVIVFIVTLLLLLRKKRTRRSHKTDYETKGFQSLWIRKPDSDSLPADLTPFMSEQYQTPSSDSDPNTITPYPLYQSPRRPQVNLPQLRSTAFVKLTASTSFRNNPNKTSERPAAKTSEAAMHAASTPASQKNLVTPAPAGTLSSSSQRHHKLPPSTENIGSGSIQASPGRVGHTPCPGCVD